MKVRNATRACSILLAACLVTVSSPPVGAQQKDHAVPSDQLRIDVQKSAAARQANEAAVRDVCQRSREKDPELSGYRLPESGSGDKPGERRGSGAHGRPFARSAKRFRCWKNERSRFDHHLAGCGRADSNHHRGPLNPRRSAGEPFAGPKTTRSLRSDIPDLLRCSCAGRRGSVA